MRSPAPTSVRIPGDIREWLDAQVKRNGSSNSSEIVRALRERMDRVSGDEVAA